MMNDIYDKDIIYSKYLNDNFSYQGKLNPIIKDNLENHLRNIMHRMDTKSNQYWGYKRIKSFQPNKNIEYYYKFNKFYKISNFKLGHFEVNYQIKLLDLNNIIFTKKNVVSIFNKIDNKIEDLYQSFDLLRIDAHDELIYSVSLPNTLTIFNYKNKTYVKKELDGFSEEKWLNFSKFVNKDKILVGGNNQNKISLINTEFKLINQYETKIESVNNVDFYEDKFFVAVGDSNIFSFIDFRVNKTIFNIKGLASKNYSNTFLNENYFATGGDDGSVYIWDMRTFKIAKVYKNFFNQIGNLKFNKKFQKLYAVERTFSTNIIDLKRDEIQNIDYYIYSAGVDFYENKIFLGIANINSGIMEMELI